MPNDANVLPSYSVIAPNGATAPIITPSTPVPVTSVPNTSSRSTLPTLSAPVNPAPVTSAPNTTPRSTLPTISVPVIIPSTSAPVTPAHSARTSLTFRENNLDQVRTPDTPTSTPIRAPRESKIRPETQTSDSDDDSPLARELQQTLDIKDDVIRCAVCKSTAVHADNKCDRGNCDLDYCDNCRLALGLCKCGGHWLTPNQEIILRISFGDQIAASINALASREPQPVPPRNIDLSHSLQAIQRVCRTGSCLETITGEVLALKNKYIFLYGRDPDKDQVATLERSIRTTETHIRELPMKKERLNLLKIIKEMSPIHEEAVMGDSTRRGLQRDHIAALRAGLNKKEERLRKRRRLDFENIQLGRRGQQDGASSDEDNAE